MTNHALALGSLSLHHAMEQDTLSALAVFHADLEQFETPDAVLQDNASLDFAGRSDDEITAGWLGAAITFFSPCPAGALGSSDVVNNLAARFNDQVNFQPRVSVIANHILHYLHRMPEALQHQPVSGLVVVDSLAAAPGFCQMDVLAAGLTQLSILTAAGGNVLWVHSEQDLHQSPAELHKAMARHLAFRRANPSWRMTGFADVGPAAGVLAGIIPGPARWEKDDDWARIACSHGVRSDYESEEPQTGHC